MAELQPGDLVRGGDTVRADQQLRGKVLEIQRGKDKYASNASDERVFVDWYVPMGDD